MSDETERVDRILAGKGRQAALRALGALVVMLVVGINIGVWWEAQNRADNAEQTVVSFAQQVQDACAHGGLPVDGRDLCDLADEVVEDPGAEPVPVNGRDGIDGTDGVDGTDGADGTDGVDGVDGTDGADGENGTDGVDGADGADGVDGVNGSPGRGLQSMQCATGGWAIKYTDGFTEPDPGPCQGPQGEAGVDGTDGTDGEDGTAVPGDYVCPDGEYVTALRIATDGVVTLTCAAFLDPASPDEGATL